jgi:hypothetical protein
MKEEVRKNGREKAQVTQEKNSLFAPLVLFRGHSHGPCGGVCGAPKRHKTGVRFGPDEQGHNGAYTTNLGLPAVADAAKAGQGESK